MDGIWFGESFFLFLLGLGGGFVGGWFGESVG